MSSLILPKKFQHIHRVMNTNINGNRMIPFAIKIPSASLYTPLLCQKRCCSSNTPQDDITVRYGTSLKELFKEVDESPKLRHDSLLAEFKAETRAVILHLRIIIGLLLLTIIGILAVEWIASPNRLLYGKKAKSGV